MDDPAPEPARGPRVLASLPDFALAALFLTVWLAPARLGAGSVSYCVLLMLLEFVVMHSAAFMGTAAFADFAKGRAALVLLGFTGLYLLFVLGFALAFDTWWPVSSFLLLCGNRILGFLLSPPPAGRERLEIQRGWAVSALLYLAGAFATVLLPLPRLGVSAEWLAAHPLPGGGLWVEEPWRAVAFGFFYFSGLGISEALSHRWLPESGLPAARESARGPKRA